MGVRSNVSWVLLVISVDWTDCEQALARAVYARRDLVLLDDVLSALDAETSELVFQRLLDGDGLLRKLGSTIILTSHSGKLESHLRATSSLSIIGRITDSFGFKLALHL